jgi:hypothetical protein
VLLLLNWTFTIGELQVECVTLISTVRRVFIGVQGGITDLVKLVTRHMVAGWPWSSASTDLRLGIPLYRLLESVTMKPTRERLHGGAGRPPPRPTGQWPFHTASSCQVPGVTLILVEFQIFL